MLRDNIWTLNITERTGRRAKSISSQSLTPVTVHPPARPHLLNLPKQQHRLGTKCSNT